jgi:hypothetical protein
MAQKIILTEHQYNLIVSETINEMLKNVDESVLLSEEPIDEGLWSKIKYNLANLTGRYKAGGKIFGKGKVDKEAAAKIKVIIDKKGNEMIKKLDDEIKQQNPKFPNNEEPKDFLNTILAISTVYDSIIAATQKDPKDETFMPIDVANGIINDLREYVKKFLDVDLKSLYSGLDEEIENGGIELSEEDLREIDEAWGLNEDYFDAVTEVEIKEDESSDVRDKLKADRAARGGGADFDSERMKTLKSNKLPLMLAGVGGSLGGLSWLAQTEWFKHWLEGLLGADRIVTTPEIVKDVTGGAPDSKGMLHWWGDVNGRELKTGADVQAFIDKMGADNLKHTFEGNGGGPIDTQIQQLQQLVGGDNASRPVGEIFNPNNDTFGSMKGGQNLFGVSKAASFFGQIVVKQAQKILIKGAGTALATKFAGLAGILGPIGVGVLVAGALVKIMRMKGQRSSRAATLNALYQSIRNIEGGVGIIEPEGPTISKDEAQDPKKIEDKNKEGDGGDKGATGGGFNDDLYNSLLNMFRFVVASNKKFGTKSDKGDKTNDETSDETSDETGFKKGDKAIYKGRNVTVTIPNVSPGSTQIDADGDGPQKRTYAVKTADLKKQVSEGLISEGRYIKDEELIKYLNKNISPKRVKEFEDFMNRVEQIRNKIRNIKKTDDKVFNQKLETFKQNPLILTDFSKLFNISSTNPQVYQNFAKFINDIFNTVYTGKFKKGDLMDKFASMGKVKADDINEAEAQFKRTQIEKDAQDRGKFKKHLMQFMTDAIGLFQYMFQKKKNMAARSGQQPQNTKKQMNKLGGKPSSASTGGAPTATPPSGGGAGASATDASSDASSGASGGGASDAGGSSDDEPKPFRPATYESVNGQNKVLTEEIERIKKIMSSLI